MTPFSLSRTGLQMQLALARFGWTKGIACALCVVGLAAWLFAMPRLRITLAAERKAVVAAQHALLTVESATPVIQRSVAEEHLANFYDVLGDAHYTEQQVKTLFAVAAKNGLVLKQADYTSAFDRNGHVRTYQIVLPVKGSYSAIRQFCEMSLLAMPFASLDDIGFKRDAITNPTLEAKLRFTLYLTDSMTDSAHATDQRSSGSDAMP